MNQRIKLLQVTHDLAIGGLQQVVVNLCAAIDRERFDISVLCLREMGPLKDEIEKMGIRVSLLPQEKEVDYLAFLKVAKILHRDGIEVVHTHNTQPLIDGTLGALLSGKRRHIIHTDHARQFPEKFRYMAAEWLMCHFVHRMVGVSEQTTANLRRYEKIPKRKLMTIENGVDGSRFRVSVNESTKRQELGLPLEGPVIGVISRIEKVKGIDTLVQALRTVVDQIPDLRLLVVGDGSERPKLEQFAAELGLKKHVVFTGARSDIPEILPVLDAYLLPSLSEGLPMGLLEAMAAGCPVIASSVGGIPAVSCGGKNVALVQPQDVEGLSAKILELLRSPELQQSLRDAAQDHFDRNFSAQSMADKYMELYEH